MYRKGQIHSGIASRKFSLASGRQKEKLTHARGRYWVQTRDQCYAGDIWKHWVVKGRIWAYFMSVLEDTNHVRWADYHFIQSTGYICLAPDYGDITLARSLHASPSQGKAAQSPAEIFWVIADYFRTQVVVFYPDEIITPGVIEYRLKPEEMNPQNPYEYFPPRCCRTR